MVRIDSLLSARLFLAPQWLGDRIFFISNLGGHLSLYAMDQSGSVPEPLLPPNIALQNPDLVGGQPFSLFPRLDKVLVSIDKDGDERYQPMLVPLAGGFPEPAFGSLLESHRVHIVKCDPQRSIVYLNAESLAEAMHTAYLGRLEDGTLRELARSPFGCEVSGVNSSNTKAALIDHYTMGDHILYLWTPDAGTRLLHGTPQEQRKDGAPVVPSGIACCHFTEGDRGLLFITSLFSDAYGLGYIDLGDPANVEQVRISGTRHKGTGELHRLERLGPHGGNRYLLDYNIDGCSWIYEGSFDERALAMTLDTVVCGEGALAQGVAGEPYHDPAGDRYCLSFSTATSPTQIYRVEGKDRRNITPATRERILGIPWDRMSPGEDASYASFDGQRTSARLYLPPGDLGLDTPYPLVYYLHGGPQSQERPNFAWFSMPLIQYLAMNGFAVFVPNARGSTGYGLRYTKQVDRDWGGDDRLDHVHAMTEVLTRDERLDLSRAGVVGRSYGGYMTLTLASRHPELWSAAIDMFGPSDLFTFLERIPETWKPYFDIALGHPVRDRDFLRERSPRTYLHQIRCPLLVIQGKNDPRVVERESVELVEQLRSIGKQVEYLQFDNEGHDVLKFENRVRCYDAIADFFKRLLKP